MTAPMSTVDREQYEHAIELIDRGGIDWWGGLRVAIKAMELAADESDDGDSINSMEEIAAARLRDCLEKGERL